MKIVSLCCGAGGIDEGIKQAIGIEPYLAVDFDPEKPEYSKDCLETIKLNHPTTETLYSNILDVEDSIGKADAVVGGPPCQKFSTANTNRDFDDTLVKCFWRIVEKTKAKYWFMENVPDVIKVLPNKKNFLINCADYGTPQTRKRRFFTNLSKPDNTHHRSSYTDLFGTEVKKWVSVREALGLEGILQDRKSTFGEGWRNYPVDKPSFTLLSDSRLWITKSGFKQQNGKELSVSIDEPAPTIVNATSYELINYKVYSLKYLQEKNPEMTAKHPANVLDEPARTLNTKDRGITTDGMVTDGKFARKLTLDECAILQGFPNTYKFFGGKTSVKRQIGNAVPSQPVKAFFEQLKS